MEEASIHGGLPDLVIGVDVNEARTTYQHQSVASRFLIRGFTVDALPETALCIVIMPPTRILLLKADNATRRFPSYNCVRGDLRNKMLLGNFALLGGVE